MFKAVGIINEQCKHNALSACAGREKKNVRSSCICLAQCRDESSTNLAL